MTISGGFCALFSLIAMIMDIKWEKVSNQWIFFGWTAGAVCGTVQGGIPGAVRFLLGAMFPVAVLFPLFVFHMLGTGDIKLFSVLAGFMELRTLVRCMLLSFLIGGMIAIPVLFFRCGARERFLYFFSYLTEYFRTGKISPYLRPGRHPENIHFTIPIFISVLIYTGGFL